MGDQAYILRPFSMSGRGYVSLGARSHILGNSHVEAIEQWKDQRYFPSVEIGNDVYIGRHFYLTAIQSVKLGDGCVLSDHVYITDLFHGFDPKAGLIMEQTLVSKGPVAIGAHSFLGYRVSIMPGVTLGERCVVGANSVVTKSFPKYSMIAGSPARLVKVYSESKEDWITPEEGPGEVS